MAKSIIETFIGTCVATSLIASASLFQACEAAPVGAKPGGDPKSSKQVEGVRLQMRSDFYGDLDTLVSRAGMKFYSARTGVTVIALPPDGRMFAYSVDSKKIYKVDMRRFSLNSKVANVTKGSSKGVYFATGKKTKIGGINAVQFANYKIKDLARLHAFRSRALEEAGHSQAAVVPCEIWAASDIVLPRTFMFIISKITQINEKELAELYGCTTAKMVKAPVPLRILRVREDGTKILALDTLSATKQKMSQNDFIVPTGLKTVSNEMALLMGDDDSFGFGSLPGQASTMPSSKASASKRTMSDLTKELGISPMAKTACPNKLNQKNVLKNTEVSGEKTGQKTAPLKLRPSAF